MNPEPMSKLLITGPKTKLERVIDELHKLKIIHVQEHKRTQDLDIGSPLGKSEQLSEIQVRLRSVADHLKVSLEKPDIIFASKFMQKHEKKTFSVIKENVDLLTSSVLEKSERIKNINENLKNIQLKLRQLKYIAALNLDSDAFIEYKSLCWFIGTVSDRNFEEKLKKITDRYKLYSAELEGNLLIALFADINKRSEVMNVLDRSGYKSADISEAIKVKGDARKILAELMQQEKNFNSKKETIAKQVESLGKKNEQLLQAADYILKNEIEKSQAPLKFGVTQNTFTIIGWVPSKDLQNVANRLYTVTDKKLFMQVLKIDYHHDNVPVKMRNKKLVQPYEFFMYLYTLPSYKELDPSFIMFLTFPFLFGFMLGDIGYGLICLIGFWLIRKKMKNALIDILMFASIGTIFFGALFGEFFGAEELFGHELPHILSRSHDITQLLYLAVAVGVIHLNLGLIIGFYNELKSHGFLKALFCKMSWIVLQIGVVLLALSYMKKLAIDPMYGYITLIIAIAMLYKGEGIQGMVELPSIFSNMLSYARLMAIGLSSVSLALVINGFVEEFFAKGGVVMIILGIILLLIGHIINIGIGILGSFLHALRLHYVEFFTKFYHGGGQEYRPFGKEQEGG